MERAINELEIAKNMVDTSHPINVAEGKLEQAASEKEASESFGKAIDYLKTYRSE